MSGEPGDAPRRRGPYRGPDGAALRARWQQDRRAVARTHHPDRGGDAHEMQRRLDAVDAAYARLDQHDMDGPAPAQTHQHTLRRVVREARRRAERLRRAGQARIPRGWPGRRRYFDL